ncbi:MAG: hypothetical protein ACOC0B_02050 [bacterium]
MEVKFYDRREKRHYSLPIELAEQHEIVQITPITPGQFQVVIWIGDEENDRSIELLDVVAWAVVRTYEPIAGAADPFTSIHPAVLDPDGVTSLDVRGLYGDSFELGIVRTGDTEKVNELVQAEKAYRSLKAQREGGKSQ